ncbi:MAG: hypothetical protein EpisKO_05770 [Epibacterium sp.]
MAIFTALAATVTAISTWTVSLGALGTFAIGNFLLRAAVQLGVSALAKAFSKKSGYQAEPFAIQGSVRTGGAVARSFGFGEFLTAGSLVWHTEWGEDGGTPNAYYTQVIALSDIPIAGLRRWFIEGRSVTLEDTGHNAGLAAVEYREDGNDHAWVRFHDGTQTVADEFLTGAVSDGAPREYSATRVGVGVAYAIVTFRLNQEIFTGFPRSKFVLDGVKLYDVSKDSTEGGSGSHRWNDPQSWGGDGDKLPAVQAYNLARGIYYGGAWFYGLQGLTAARLPASHWIGQIEKCRATTPGEDGPEPLFRCAGEITVNSEIGSAFEAVLTSCAGRMSEVGGIFKIYVGSPDAPIVHFDDEDILSLAPQTFTPFFGLSDTVNGVVGSYPSPDEGYVMRSTPPIYNAQFEAEDGGRRLLTDVQLSFVPYAAQAQRLLRGELAAARRARRHTHSLPARFRLIEPGDVVSWSSARNGYTEKQFRVDGVIDLPNCDLIVDLTEVDPSDHGSWDHETDFTPVDPLPLTPVRPVAQAVFGFSVVARPVVDAVGLPRRPSLVPRWNTGVDDIAGLRFVVRLASSGVVVARVQTHAFGDGEFIISDGILPNTAYQVKAQYIPGLPRRVLWSNWVDVTSDDLRFGEGDFSPEFWASVGAQAENIASSLNDDLVADVIAPIARDLQLQQVEQRTVAEAIGIIGDKVLWAISRIADFDGRFADAGIVVDPDTGSVRIYAVEQEAERISEAEIRLSAAEASLALSATRAWVNEQISLAVLDPTQIPLLTDLQLQINQVEIELDAAAAAVALSASQTVVDGIDARLSTARADLDAAQAEISLKADRNEYEDLSGRVQSAEVQIASLDGPQIVQTVADTRHLIDASEAAAMQTLANLLQAHEAGERVRVDIAYATQDLRARVDEDREAVASLGVSLGASIENAMALLEAESLVRASADSALASDVATLGARIGGAEDGVAAQAQAQSQMAARVSSLEGVTSSQAQVITSLSAEVDRLGVDQTDQAEATQSLTVQVSSFGDQISAQAQSIASLSTAVGENTTTVETVSESVDGMLGRHMLRVNVNGVATGMVIASEAGSNGSVSSSVAFSADSFSIANPDGSGLVAPFSVYTAPRVVDGHLLPAGVYMERAFIGRAAIGRAQIADTLQSDDYAENAKGRPTSGIQIDFASGGVKAAGLILSRPLAIARGSFRPTGSFSSGARWAFVNTGIKVGKSDVWQASQVALVASAAISSSATANSGFDPNNTFWALDARIQPGARWNGFGGGNPAPSNEWSRDPSDLIKPWWSSANDQRLYLAISLETLGGVFFQNPKIEWTVFEVT